MRRSAGAGSKSRARPTRGHSGARDAPDPREPGFSATSPRRTGGGPSGSPRGAQASREWRSCGARSFVSSKWTSSAWRVVPSFW